MKDLPAIDLEGISDPFAKFEASLPFNRTLVTLMLQKLDEAEKECGEEGFVTLAALRRQLSTSAWQPLTDPNSTLSKTLLSAAFKDAKKKQTAEQIDVNWLKVWALLHCSGKPIDKTRAFFCILQEGGFEKHDQISAGDKDFIPVFDKVCAFATADVFGFAHEAGMLATPLYSADEAKQLLDVCEILREDHWLEQVYGANSRLQSDDWVQKVSTTANWIFNPSHMRHRLFELAQVAKRH